ncbi:MAG TPA: hypothetical protein VGK74_28780 [Symbiobacteriaceae bacterium]|jgi:PAS domain-containing protein
MAGSMAGRGFEPSALRRYELLSENTRDIVLFIHPDGHILEANRAAVLAFAQGFHWGGPAPVVAKVR